MLLAPSIIQIIQINTLARHTVLFDAMIVRGDGPEVPGIQISRHNACSVNTTIVEPLVAAFHVF